MNKIKKITHLLIGSLFLTVVTAQQEVANPSIPAAPPQKPGQCHALVNIPAKLVSRVEEIPAQGEGESLSIIQADYQWVEKKIKIKEEEKTLNIIPAKYEVIEEKIIIEPERKEYEVIPAIFNQSENKIVVRPAMRVWKKSKSGAASLSGEVMRLIEQAPKYKTLIKKEMKTPPRIREIVIPPKYATLKKTVVKTPAKTEEIIIPAEYKTVRVKELVSAAREDRQMTPPIMQEVAIQEVIEPAQLNWRRVPCDKDLNEENVTVIQKKLLAIGYAVIADGKFGQGTREALKKFQEKEGLPKGAVTIETLKKLGVNID